MNEQLGPWRETKKKIWLLKHTKKTKTNDLNNNFESVQSHFFNTKKTNEMGRLQTINELNVKGRKRPSLPPAPPAGGGAAPAPPAPPSKGFF